MKPMLRALLIAIAPLGLLLGCGDGLEADKANVSGKVILDGKALANVGVHFVLEGETTFAGVARTLEDGSFELVHGAEVGINRVYFSDLSASDTQKAMASPDWNGQEVIGPAIPKQYADPSRSPLTFDVPTGGSSDAVFDLTSK